MSLSSNHSQSISNRTSHSHSIKLYKGVALETTQTSEGIVEEAEAEVTVADPELVTLGSTITKTRISSTNPNLDSLHLGVGSDCHSRIGTMQIKPNPINLYHQLKGIKVTFLREAVLTILGEASIIKTREVEIQITEEEEAIIIIPSMVSFRIRVAVVVLGIKITLIIPTNQ